MAATVVLVIGAAAVFFQISRDGPDSLSPPDASALVSVAPAELFYDADRTNTGRIEFTLTNKGDAPLVIRSTEVSCTCTNVKFSEPPVLQPGMALPGVLQVTPPAFGTQDTAFVMHFSGAPSLTVPVRLKGKEVFPPFVRKAPTQISHEFPAVATARSIEFDITTVEFAGDSSWLTGIAADRNELQISAPRILTTTILDDRAVMRTYRTAIEWLGDPDNGREIDAILALEVASEPVKEIRTIPVQLSVTSPLRAHPSTIILRPDEPAMRTVRLSSTSVDDWEILDVSASVDWVSVETIDEPGEPKQAFRVGYRPSILPDEQTARGTVTIRTSHPLAPAIDVIIVRGSLARETSAE